MAEVKGAINLLNKALPTGVDGTRLAEWALRDGITYGELINQVALAIARRNQMRLDKWGFLFFITEELFMEYPNGGSVSPAPELTDMDRPEPTHGTTIGHMLDKWTFGDAIGGTRRYFRDVRSATINAAISTIMNTLDWRFEQKLLGRLSSNTENAIGSAGYDVPFVRGTGGVVDFAPPAYQGEAFTTSHSHFVGVDDDSKDYDDMMEELAEHLSEHGHMAPYDAIISRTDVPTVAALKNFVKHVNVANLIVLDRGGQTTGNQYFARVQQEEGMYFADYETDYGTVRLHMTARYPTKYATMVKSYGQNDVRNPLAVRVHPDEGFGAYIEPETTLDDDVPVKQLDIIDEYGIGVGQDRTNGVNGYLVSGGTWANPTIS